MCCMREGLPGIAQRTTAKLSGNDPAHLSVVGFNINR
jgi:hypothetical protein